MIPTVFDHLWQSTLFACGAGLLAVALRRHPARTRYWLWFAASVKFLVPFSLLESVGSWMAPRAEVVVLSQPVLAAVDRISTPFAPIPTAAISFAATTPPISATHVGAVQFALLHSQDVTTWLAAVWLAGTIVFITIWTVRWLRLLAVVRIARPVDIEAPIRVKATASRIEPGLVGVLRPVLLLPDGLGAHMSPREIRSLIAHEVSHLHRRDNLTAAVHMIVEAVFWFYPLTWWLGARLVAERERACDESVLASGHDPEAYAEGILKVCRFYIQAPLPCTAGVSGADLKKRIEVIMSSPAVRRLSVATRFSIALAGLASLTAPVLYGLISASAMGAPAAAHVTAVQTTSSQTTSAQTTTTAATTSTASDGASDIASRTYEQTRPQKEVPFNPTDFDKYAGYYRGDNGGFAHVYRTGDRYFLQLTGQPPAEFFPESPTEFFATIVAAQMSFVVGPGGRVTGMVIHQSGLLLSLARISKAEFDAGGAELAERVKNNTPSPGTREMVLSYIKTLEQGRPQNYDTMTPMLAAAARQQSAQASAAIRKVGAFKSLEFSRVLPNGANIYIATFTHGQLMWVIMPLTKDGKVPGMVFRPFPP